MGEGVEMHAITPSTAQQQYPPIRSQPLEPPEQSRRRLLRPLAAVCVVQTALSLTLVWSNTAFADEAYYLWAGHLEIAHWLHGASLPQSMLEGNLSGSPIIYPPIGALADTVGGLAAARIVSLIFMLAATILLYLTAMRLFGRTAALVASTLWAASEPVMRLAFATYDPMSVLLTALSAWLALQAIHRRHRSLCIIAAAASLALANATAYSGVVIDPIVITFALLVWLSRMRLRAAFSCVAWLIAGWAVFFVLIMTASRSWTGISFTVLNRNIADYQSNILIVSDVWKYTGLIMLMAMAAGIAAISTEPWRRAILIVFLVCAMLAVPLGQLHSGTAVSMDKHLAYGIWFGAIGAGYGFSRLTSPFAHKHSIIVICSAIAVIYPFVNGWEGAWRVYHSWPNATRFVDAFRPIAAKSSGTFFVPAAQGHGDHISEYYLAQGTEWTRWDNPGLELSPANAQSNSLVAYYGHQLSRYSYGAIVLFYKTTFSDAQMSEGILLPKGLTNAQNTKSTYGELLGQIGANSHEPGLSALTLAIEQDPQYKLVATGPYNTQVSFTNYYYGFYAIWQKVRM
jgi:hypothetical protein